MYEQTHYRYIKPGQVYHCPPGGQTYLCLKNTQPGTSNTYGTDGEAGELQWFVIEESYMGPPAGTVFNEKYSYFTQGSWTKL